MIKKQIMFFWLLFVFIIFSPIMVKAIEVEEKQELGLKDNPYYVYYQNLSESEKENFQVVPRPYLLEKSLLIDEGGIHTPAVSVNSRARQVLPSKYILTQDIKIAGKDQKNLETCWAFTALRCLETHLALNHQGYYDFSELHLDYLTSELYGGDRKLHDGGNFYDFIDYVQEGLGPVLEEELPLQTDVTEENTVESQEMIQKVQNLIQERGLEKESVTPRVTNIVARAFESLDITKATEAEIKAFQNDIKTYLQHNGAIEAYLFFENFLDCYSEENATFLSPVAENIEFGHGVNVIGWDDNYPKENFTGKYQPSQDGAWIVTNSWGEDWGENGCFYISYEDYFFYQYLTGIEEAEVVPTKVIDISIVNLSSRWEYEWKKETQKIVITPILGQNDSEIQAITVNGEPLEIVGENAYYTISQNGNYEIEVKDNQGNIAKKIYQVDKLDMEKPKVQITTNSTNSSNPEIIFTVTAEEQGESGLTDYLLIRRSGDEEGVWFTVSADTRYENTGELFWSEGFEKDVSGKQIVAGTKFVFSEEGSYTLYAKAVDMAGNESEVASYTAYYDTTPPQLQVEYDTLNTGRVTIFSNERLQPLDGWLLSEDGLQLKKLYLQSTQEEIMVKDEAGNSSEVSIQVVVENPVMLGDMNQDNTINTADVIIVLRYIASKKSSEVQQVHPDWKLEENVLLLADVNQDGKVELADVLLLQRHLAFMNSEVVKQKYPEWSLTGIENVI